MAFDLCLWQCLCSRATSAVFRRGGGGGGGGGHQRINTWKN